MRELPANVLKAIRSGPVPVLREWRTMEPHEWTRAERNMAFCERYLVIPEGSKQGAKVQLHPFQEAFFYAVFDNPHGTRTAFLTVGRKNGKTALIAMILLCFLIGPEKRSNSKLSSGALSRDQAAIVYEYASKMIASSDPRVAAMVKATPSQKALLGLTCNVSYRALSADGKTNHGGSPYVAILDEMGQIKGRYDAFVEAVWTSQGAYDDAIRFVISTQAANDADWLSMELDDAISANNPRVVCHLYEAAPNADVDDEKAWYDANPGLGTILSYTEIKEAAEKAKRSPDFENTFRSLHLNQRVAVDAPFVSRDVWLSNGSTPRTLEGMEVFAGLDLATNTDLVALTLAAKDEDGLIHCHNYFWMPGDLVQDRAREDRQPYDVWVRQGLIRTTSGKAIDWGDLARDIDDILTGLDVKVLRFDRYKISLLKTAFAAIGITPPPLEEFGQGFVSMAPAINALEVMLLNSRLAHGNNPVLTMCAANAVVVKDPAGNRKFDKGRVKTGRIDGMVSLTMAVGGMETEIKAREKEFQMLFF